MASQVGLSGKPGAYYDPRGDGLVIHRGGRDLSALGKIISKRKTKRWANFYHSINDEAVMMRGVLPYTVYNDRHKDICWDRAWVDIFVLGMHMDRVTDGLRESREEVAESRKELEHTLNDLTTLQEAVERRLGEHITKLRTARMTALAEIAQSTQALRDVRKFFMESDYHEEMRRLREFTELCERLQKLKASGALDAICDSALHLAVTE